MPLQAYCPLHTCFVLNGSKILKKKQPPGLLVSFLHRDSLPGNEIIIYKVAQYKTFFLLPEEKGLILYKQITDCKV